MAYSDFSKLFPSFPNYTEEMYNGNEPSSKEYLSIDNSIHDIWSTQYGKAETCEDRIITAIFNIGAQKSISIIGNSLWVVKLLQKGVYEYCYNHGGIGMEKYGMIKFDLSKEETLKIINTKIENCKLWEMVQKRALELYNESLEK